MTELRHGYKLLVCGAATVARQIVYGLVDPRSPNVVRYVGQTVNDPGVRHRAHVRPTKWDKSVRAMWCRALTAEGTAPDMVLLEHVAEGDDLTDRERWWIMTLQAEGEADLNKRRIPLAILRQFHAFVPNSVTSPSDSRAAR